jgi:6-phosphogluconolactonase
LAAGTEKAHAVATALGDADPWALPASAVRGTRRTVWMVDESAAAYLPKQLLQG